LFNLIPLKLKFELKLLVKETDVVVVVDAILVWKVSGKLHASLIFTIQFGFVSHIFWSFSGKYFEIGLLYMHTFKSLFNPTKEFKSNTTILLDSSQISSNSFSPLTIINL